MLTTVLLYGQLAKFAGRRSFRFDIDTPAQAVAALEMARPGFTRQIAKMQKHAFIVRVGKKKIIDKYLRLPANGKTISISPILEAAATAKGILEIVAGVVLIAAAVVLSPYTGATSLAWVPSSLALLGVGVALGGVAQLLAPSPPQVSSKDAKKSGSFIFDGAENTMAQGGMIAIPLGRVMTGSNVVSADIVASDITRGSNNGVPGGDNSGASLDGAHPGGAAHPAFHVITPTFEP